MVKCIYIITMGMFLAGTALSGTVSDPPSLNTLKEKYTVAAGQIDRTAYLSYTNGLCSLIQQAKTRRDIDACLLLQNEQKESMALPIIPAEAVRHNLATNVLGYSAMLATIEGDRADQVANLNRFYITRLDALMSELLSADQLEAAKRVKEEMDKILGLAKLRPDNERPVTNSTPVAMEIPSKKGELPAATVVNRDAMVKPVRNLQIVKAILTRPDGKEDVTELIRDKVEDAKLEINHYNFLRGKLPKRAWARNGEDKLVLVVHYKYNNGVVKIVRANFGDPLVITE